MDRRTFITVSSLATGGMMLGCRPNQLTSPEAAYFGYNVYVSIGNDDVVRIAVPVPEIGQGVRTSLAMLVAEELEFPWEKIEVVQADGGEDYEGRNQRAAGSNSVKVYWEPMSKAGAAAREMLVQAASNRWGMAPQECSARDG